MKSIHRFFASLCTILLIAACSSSTSADNTYPYQVGTFSITSESRANWTGQRGLFAQRTFTPGDTVRYTNPDSLSMYIGVTDNHRGFIIEAVDSSFDEKRADSLGVSYGDYSVQGDPAIELSGTAIAGNPVDINGVPLLHFSANYDCSVKDSSANAQSAVFTFNLVTGHRGSYSPYKRYELRVDGLRQTLQHIVCGVPAPE